MGKRFKKRFSSLCCCRVRVSDASDPEVKDDKAKTPNQRTCKPAVSMSDVNPLLLKQTERRLTKENMFIKKLENFHECLNQSVDDLGCNFKGIVRMDKALLQKYIEVMGDFGITQENAHTPKKVEDDVKRKDIINEIQLKDFNNVLTEDIRRETKALLFDIQKRNKDHEKRFVDGLQGHNLSTNASVPFVGAEMEMVDAFSRYPINDSPLKYRELTPRIDAVIPFLQTIPPIRNYRKTEICNLNIYNPRDVFRHTEYTPTKPNLGTVVECARYTPQREIGFYNPSFSQENTVGWDASYTLHSTLDGILGTFVTLPVKYEAQQILECDRYMPQREIGLCNSASSQENKSAWVHTTLDWIANNYTVTVVRAENDGLHLPGSTSGQRSFIQGPVWVISLTPKTRILQSDKHQELMPTMGNKKHVITICVRPLLTRRLDQYGLIKGEGQAFLNQDIPFRIENSSRPTQPFVSASVVHKFQEFLIRKPAIMQVETSQDRQRNHVFQTEKLTDRVFSLATVKVATVFTYDEPIIHIAVPIRMYKILSQRQASRLINGPSRKVHKAISNEDSTDDVTDLLVPLLHSTRHTREKLKPLVMVSNIRSLKELCQIVSDTITPPKPRQSENMGKQCLTNPEHTDQETSKDLTANVANRDTKADEHCGDGDQQDSCGSPKLRNENTSTSQLIKTDASPKSDGRHKPTKFVRLGKSFEKPRLKALSRKNGCPVVAGIPHTERCPKADKYPGTNRQCDKSPQPETAPVGLVPSRSHSKAQALANVKDESMQDIDKLVSLRTKVPEVKEDLSKAHHFVYNKRPMLSLKYLMGKGFHFEEIHAKFLIINLLHILKFLLGRRIIHTDICPEKIVFNNKGYPCLTGYEKSEIIGGCRRDSKFEIPKIEFCSPEQFCKKDDITEATDIFSTGALVYRMLYGRSPHKDVNYQKTKANLLRDSYIPMFKPDGILAWTGKLFIAHCIRHDPKQRFSIKRSQSSLVDSVKWFRGLDEHALINQTDPSPFSEFLHGNQNTAISGTTATSGTTVISGTTGITGTTGTTSGTPEGNLKAMPNRASSQPASKLPTRVLTQGMVKRLSSHRLTSHKSQHI